MQKILKIEPIGKETNGPCSWISFLLTYEDGTTEEWWAPAMGGSPMVGLPGAEAMLMEDRDAKRTAIQR